MGDYNPSLEPHQRYDLVCKAKRFCMSNDDLYMRCSDGVMRKVLKYEEICACLATSHEDGCGGHFGAN